MAQVDGEPWMQGPATLSVSLRGGAKGSVLRRLPANSPAARMQTLVHEVLEASERHVRRSVPVNETFHNQLCPCQQGTITEEQKASLIEDLITKLHSAFV